MKQKCLSLLAAAALLTVCTACTGSHTGSSADPDAADSSADQTLPVVSSQESEPDPAASEQGDESETEQLAAAASGDAYLFICDERCYLSYDGTADTLLACGAVCTPIKDNGQYTVRVSTDTAGCRLAVTGDPNAELTAGGLSYAAVAVKDGAVNFPELCITIDKVLVNGREIPLTAQNYTYSPDGTDLRAVLYSGWDSRLPEGARTPNGPVSGDFGTYSAQIAELSDFAGWKTVEVTFTVSGIKE